jgi:hypothetical protein
VPAFACASACERPSPAPPPDSHPVTGTSFTESQNASLVQGSQAARTDDDIAEMWGMLEHEALLAVNRRRVAEAQSEVSMGLQVTTPPPVEDDLPAPELL